MRAPALLAFFASLVCSTLVGCDSDDPKDPIDTDIVDTDTDETDTDETDTDDTDDTDATE